MARPTKRSTSFVWNIPEFYNIGVDICDKWAHQRYRLALIFENEKGETEYYTFWDLKRLSNRLANGLKAQGLSRGDRFGIMLPQSPEAGIAHIALYKMGAIAIPLFTLFGTEALEYRLANSEAKGNCHGRGQSPQGPGNQRPVAPSSGGCAGKGQKRDGIFRFHDLVEKGPPLRTVVTRAMIPHSSVIPPERRGLPKERSMPTV